MPLHEAGLNLRDASESTLLLPQSVRSQDWVKLVTAWTRFDIAKIEGRHRVRLVPEPDNKFHTRAIQVYLEEIHIGYLTWGYAKDVQDLIDEYCLSNLYCDLLVKRWNHTYVGNLLIEDWEPFLDWLDLGGRPPSGLTSGSYRLLVERLWIKRSGKHQDALRQLMSGGSATWVEANFRIGETARGKYAGEPHITVLADGLEIGELPAQFRTTNSRHAQLYASILAGALRTTPLKLFWHSSPFNTGDQWAVAAQLVTAKTERFQFLELL